LSTIQCRSENAADERAKHESSPGGKDGCREVMAGSGSMVEAEEEGTKTGAEGPEGA
jgi:hypothetical protein